MLSNWKTVGLGVAALIVIVVVGLGLFAQQFWKPQRISLTIPAASPLLNLVPSPSPASPNITLLFGGDLMFDRHIRQRISEHDPDFILEKLDPVLTKYDAVIANLEGPITNNESRSLNSAPGSTSNFIFTFDPAIAPLLKRHNLQIVNLGNNHSGNFGEDGVKQTKQNLLTAQVNHFGNTSFEATSADRILLKKFKTLTIAFVNYNQFVNQGWDTALADTKVARKQADLVIVMPHWGIEYQTQANQVIQTEAHELIEAGADLVIGGHPHVVQQIETYHGKQIYYSLGNFVFDQYFSPETTHGLLVGVEIKPDKTMTFTPIPIQLDNTGQTSLTN